jgi:serine protease Do
MNTTRAILFSVLLSFAPISGSFAQEATPPAPIAPVTAIAMIPSSFADLAASVQDSVVNISTTQKIEPRQTQRHKRIAPMPMPQFPPGSPFQDFFDEFFNGPQGMIPLYPEDGLSEGDAAPRAQSLGSGFIIDAAKGYVVTNNHVIEDADEVQVTLHDDTTLDAKIIGRDSETDLALLQVKPSKTLKAVPWGNSDTMRVGDWILAVGNPFGLGGTVTSGIISARQRNINAGRYDDFIQTDAPINRGNSGGPMFNLKGEVIGINAVILSPTGGSVGIGFAIPSNLAKSVINQLIEFGGTKRGWIGVNIQDVTKEIADSLGLPNTKGALVSSITPDGPSAKAGLKQGDVITRFNGQEIAEMRHLPRIVAETPIGKQVPMTILRMGKEMELRITPGQLEKAKEDGLIETAENDQGSSDTPKAEAKIEALSLRIAPLSPALRQLYNIADDIKSGVVITRVTGGDAADKGLRSGDVLLEVNQHTITKTDDVVRAIDEAKKTGKSAVLLLVNTRNNLRFVAVKLGEKK